MDDALFPGENLTRLLLNPGCHEGIAIESLEAGATLTIRTEHSRYRLVVIDSARHHVLADGGVLPDSVSAVLQGASMGGSLVKTGWIGVGLRMELIVDAKRIVTSPVRAVSIHTSRSIVRSGISRACNQE